MLLQSSNPTQWRDSVCRMMFDHYTDAMLVLDESGHIVLSNEEASRFAGVEAGGLDGMHLTAFFDPQSAERIWRFIEQKQADKLIYCTDFMRLCGEKESIFLTVLPVLIPEGISGMLMITRKKKNIVHTENRLSTSALYDSLTGLSTRAQFITRLQLLLLQAENLAMPISLFYCDIDHFKTINESLGHQAGDQLLIAVSERMLRCFIDRHNTARTGDDEFMAIIPHSHQEDRSTLAEQIMNKLNQPYCVNGQEVQVTWSMGIASYPMDSRDAEILMKQADTAMLQSKQQGRNRVTLYSEKAMHPMLDKLLIHQELMKAIKNNEITLVYQPVVDSRTNRIVGIEALARWDHAAWGAVPPNTFIPVAEETGLIIPLSSLVLRKACIQAKAWVNAGLVNVPVAVNVSAKQFQQDDLVSSVRQILEETGLPPQYLDLEITESAVMQNIEEAVMKLQQLKQLGLRAAMDDFGTGYSSLNYLKRLPIDTLKIDRSFVKDLASSAEDLAIVTAIITLARRLGLRVIAEGIETKEQLSILRSLGCDEMQGWLFSCPAAADELGNYLLKNK